MIIETKEGEATQSFRIAVWCDREKEEKYNPTKTFLHPQFIIPTITSIFDSRSKTSLFDG